MLMDNDQAYFQYLRNRSVLGRCYRKYVLYPRIERHVSGTVLDIGCGIGDFLVHRPGTVGLDINRKTVEWCRKMGLTAHLMKQDVVPFPDKFFDSIVLDNVLEHLENPTPLIREMHRVLHENGAVVVGVPGRKGYASDQDHKVFYDENKLVSTFESLGFQLRCLFHMPIKFLWLDRYMRQYCIYGVFERV